MTNRVFVYGTLKKGNFTRGMDRFGNAEFIGTALTSEALYKMYSLGAFPAVSMSGDSTVKGEVWQVDNETFKILDQIEGYPDFYTRSVVNTTLGEAWMYHIETISEFRADQLISNSEGILEWRT